MHLNDCANPPVKLLLLMFVFFLPFHSGDFSPSACLPSHNILSLAFLHPLGNCSLPPSLLSLTTCFEELERSPWVWHCSRLPMPYGKLSTLPGCSPSSSCSLFSSPKSSAPLKCPPLDLCGRVPGLTWWLGSVDAQFPLLSTRDALQMWVPRDFRDLQAGRAGDEEPAQLWQCLVEDREHVGTHQAPGVDFTLTPAHSPSRKAEPCIKKKNV